MEQVYLSLPSFLLVLSRVTAFFMTIPFFSYRTIPTMHKAGFSAYLSWIMFMGMDVKPIVIDQSFILLELKEIVIGLLLGLIAYMIVASIQVAGGLIDFQMGFAMANVMDPQTGASIPLMGQYVYILSIILLISIDGHHVMLNGIFNSYQVIPLDTWSFSLGDRNIIEFMAKVVAQMFIIAFQMALPIVGSLFLVDVTLGIVAKTVPQMNIFVIGMPIKVIAGLSLLVVIFSSLFYAIKNMFGVMFNVLEGLMKLLGAT